MPRALTGIPAGGASGADVFLAGVIQGSAKGAEVVAQDYRTRIRSIIATRHPDLRIYDPVAHHPNSIVYDLERARATFHGHLDLVARCRLVVAYLPEASMGTAIEMWEAQRRGIPVVSISELRANWVVRLLSTVVCENLASFSAWVACGRLDALLAERRGG